MSPSVNRETNPSAARNRGRSRRPAPPSRTDQELVELAKQGRQRAFRELHNRYERRVLRFIYDYLGDATAARDVTQEAFAKAFAAIDTLRAGENFRSWLFRIARNVARDW